LIGEASAPGLRSTGEAVVSRLPAATLHEWPWVAIVFAKHIIHSPPGARDIEPFGSAHDVVELQAAEALGTRRNHRPDDPQLRASSPGPWYDQAQARAHVERSMVRNQ
jgi:hypothetical protein